MADALGKKRGTLAAYEASLCGSIAGGTAAALTTPLDVLKTRIMLDLQVRINLSSSDLSNAVSQSSSTMPSPLTRFVSIYRTEGLRSLFSGAVPRTLWISAGGAVFLGAYEWTVGGMQKMH
jgi:solute carrier family 25 S-adenosylmethionine transporter 26